MYLTDSEAKTEALAASLALSLQKGDLIALYGGLGSGKTAFVRGLARGLGIRDTVSSPTFALVHRYRGDKAKGIPALSHYDFDRITDPDALEDSGFFEALERGDILVTEWSERIEEMIPKSAIRIRISVREDGKRAFSLELPEDRLIPPLQGETQ